MKIIDSLTWCIRSSVSYTDKCVTEVEVKRVISGHINEIMWLPIIICWKFLKILYQQWKKWIFVFFGYWNHKNRKCPNTDRFKKKKVVCNMVIFGIKLPQILCLFSTWCWFLQFRQYSWSACYLLLDNPS